MIAQYRYEHDASRQGADRRWRPESLHGLLRWAQAQYVAETPNLEHAVSEVADDGDPLMRYAARAYLALTDPKGDDQRPDDWVRIASKVDADGMYRTPLRRALELLPHDRRILLRDLIPERLRPLDVAAIHGIPEWCAGDVFYRSLVMLWDRYLDRPIPSGRRSESQNIAEAVA